MGFMKYRGAMLSSDLAAPNWMVLFSVAYYDRQYFLGQRLGNGGHGQHDIY